VHALPLAAGINEGGHCCHNPTNNPKQLKTTFVGVVLLSVKNHTTPPPHRDYILSHFQAAYEVYFWYEMLSMPN
jgi:hypothetical protein